MRVRSVDAATRAGMVAFRAGRSGAVGDCGALGAAGHVKPLNCPLLEFI